MDSDLIERMRQMAPYSSKRDVAKALGVTYDWVKHHGNKHGIVFKGRSDVWSAADIKHFRKLVDIHGSVSAAAKHYGMDAKRFANIIRRAEKRLRETPLDTSILKGMRINAIGLARKNGMNDQDAEDFGSYCMIEALRLRKPINLKFAFMAWRGTQLGDPNGDYGRIKYNAQAHALPLSPSDSGYDDEGGSDGHVEADNRGMRWHEVIEMLSQRTEGLGIVARLIVLFGFSDAEVSMVMGKDATGLCVEVRRELYERA